MVARFKKVFYMLVEMLLGLCLHPAFRAKVLRVFGANIGSNVRIYDIHLFNLSNGFSNLTVCDDVFIGDCCKLDLEGPIYIGQGSALSVGVTVITHSDPGSFHGSSICREYPPFKKEVKIGSNCWLGANSTFLPGSIVGDEVVVGACSLVIGELCSGNVYCGVPTKLQKKMKNIST